MLFHALFVAHRYPAFTPSPSFEPWLAHMDPAGQSDVSLQDGAPQL